MCQHALREHGSLKPVPPTFSATVTAWINVSAAVVIAVVVASASLLLLDVLSLPTGTVPAILALGVGFLFLRTRSCPNFQLSSAELRSLSQAAEQQAWEAKARADRLAIADRLG